MSSFKSPTRRQFLGALTASMLVGLGGYAGLIEPNEITVEHVYWKVSRLPEAFEQVRIVQLSDLHYGPYTGEREIGKAVAQANALQADIAVVTGDFVTVPAMARGRNPKLADLDSCGRILGQLRAPLGIFACRGNHDVSLDADEVKTILSGHGIHLTCNSAEALERNGARLWIAGVDDVLRARADLDQALARTAGDEFTILLAHEPDFADYAATRPIDLQLSGHSHGGQIRLPLLGAPYYPPLSRKYPLGQRLVRNMHLYTNRGIGTIVVPMRFGAPPEVTLFTLSRLNAEPKRET